MKYVPRHGRQKKKEKDKFTAGSVHPPRHDPPDAADNLVRPSSCLLDPQAYFGNRKNSSTASCLARGGRLVQVTFFISHPPRVSHLCVCCPGKSPYEEFASEPDVVAMEADLVLIRMVFGPCSNITNARKYDFFVYRAAGAGRTPSLTRILPPKPFFFPQNFDAALLPRYEQDPDLYHIVILRKRMPGPWKLGFSSYSEMELQQRESLQTACPSFNIHVYNSNTAGWVVKPTLLVQQHDDLRGFYSDKVLTIGGEGGTVAWVDLQRGFLQCDVLNGASVPELHYVQLPPKLNPAHEPHHDTWIERDIALIQGQIKFVDLQLEDEVCPMEGCTAVTYSRAADNPFQLDWLGGNCVRLDARHVSVKPMLLEILSEWPDISGTPKPSLEKLSLRCPVLSLHRDLVYIMARVGSWDTNALVFAFDITKGTLEKVEQARADRCLGTILPIMQSQISKYLDMDPGSRGKGKRRGKKQPGKDPLAGSRPDLIASNPGKPA